jgi:hypothetical protein
VVAGTAEIFKKTKKLFFLWKINRFSKEFYKKKKLIANYMCTLELFFFQI